tara:strand:- start:845 stop:1687 length:843 start_codon:yes stop_codon:yes gene_type:complete
MEIKKDPGKIRRSRVVGGAATEVSNYTYRIRPDLRLRLELASNEKKVSFAYILDEALENYLDRSKSIEKAKELIEGSPPSGIPADLFAEMYSKLDNELGLQWEQSTDAERQVLVYVACFPHFGNGELSQLSGVDKEIVGRIRKKEICTTVANLYAQHDFLSSRPKVLSVLAEKAVTSNNPAFMQMFFKFLGEMPDYIKQEHKVDIRQLSLTGNISSMGGIGGVSALPSGNPKDIDSQIMLLSEKVNMTPKRFELLWSSREDNTLALEPAEVLDVEYSTEE